MENAKGQGRSWGLNTDELFGTVRVWAGQTFKCHALVGVSEVRQQLIEDYVLAAAP